MFDRMSGGFDGLDGLDELGGAIPVDVSETDDSVTVTADLPGYDTDDIDVSVRENQLTVSAEREREEETEDDHYHRRERSHQAVSRSVRLPTDVEEDQASASYTNGVLTVTLPKADPDSSDSHRIDIG